MRHGCGGLLKVAAITVLVAASVGTAAAQDATPTPPGCVAGSAGIGDGYFPTMGNGGYDVQHYDLDLRIDVETSEILAATATIEALAVAALCSFDLDFEGLDIDGITVDGRDAAWLRRGKELVITPDQPLGAGDDITTVVRYHGTPIIQPGLGDGPPVGGDAATPVAAGASSPAGVGGAGPDEATALPGGWFVAEDEVFILGEPTGKRTWYPLNEHPADKATYAFRFTVQEPYVVVTNGLKTGDNDNGATRMFTYASADPIANYLVTFHAGRLEVEELEGPHGLPVTLSFAPTIPEDERAVYRRLPEMITWAETVFGPYPFELAGATVVGAPFQIALETQTLPIFGAYGLELEGGLSVEELAALKTADIEDTLVHELAHQWFGDAVSVQRWRDMWLNEGFATYAQALWLEETQGVDARDERLRGLYGAVLDETRFLDPERLPTFTAADVLRGLQERGELLEDASVESFRSSLGAADDAALDDIPAENALDALAAGGFPVSVFPGLAVLAGDPGPPSIFSYATYDRGALTLHALRLTVGDDAFFAILSGWVERYGGGNAATADLVAVAEEISGQELSPLFDAWLFTLPTLDGIG